MGVTSVAYTTLPLSRVGRMDVGARSDVQDVQEEITTLIRTSAVTASAQTFGDTRAFETVGLEAGSGNES